MRPYLSLSFLLLSLSTASVRAQPITNLADQPMERVWETPPPATPDNPAEEGLPGNSISLGFGFAFGGDKLIKVEFDDGSELDLKAGTGLIVNAGGKLTPLWVERRVGFGLGAEMGWKFTSVQAQNGSVDLRRFPLVVSAHALLHLRKGFYLVAAGGMHTEFGVRLSSDFAGLDVDRSSKVGGMGELGVYYAQSHLALDATLRYTGLRYEVNSESIDASNIGVMFKFHYNFF